MPPTVAAAIVAFCIGGLFFLDRGGKGRVSIALWIPTTYLFITTSRPVSAWVGMSPTADSASIYLEGSPIDRTAFIVLEALALVVNLNRRRLVGPLLRRNWAVALFFLYAALSISWSDFPIVTLKHWVKGIGDVMMVMIVLTEPNVATAVERLGTRIAFIFMPLSVLFIKYYPQLGRTQNNSWTFEACGVATQKNSLGGLCAFFGLLIVWRLRRVYEDGKDASRGRRLLSLGAVLVTIIWLLRTCDSTTSICCLIMGSVVMVASTRPSFCRRPVLVHFTILAAIALVASLLFLPSLGAGALVRGLGKDGTLTGRTDLWPILLSVPNNRLLGAGYESFWLGPRAMLAWEQLPNFHITSAHNGYIEIFLNLGWVGVSLLGVLIATGYRNVVGGYRRDPVIGSLRIALFLAPVISALTEAAFRITALPWIMFLLATTGAVWALQPRLRGTEPVCEEAIVRS